MVPRQIFEIMKLLNLRFLIQLIFRQTNGFGKSVGCSTAINVNLSKSCHAIVRFKICNSRTKSTPLQIIKSYYYYKDFIFNFPSNNQAWNEPLLSNYLNMKHDRCKICNSMTKSTSIRSIIIMFCVWQRSCYSWTPTIEKHLG